MEKVNVGIIGLGQMGKIHLNTCLQLEDANLIAVSDISKKELLKAKNAGIKHVYEQYPDLLKNPEIDAVIISLPTYLHEQAAVGAAEHGKHILLEKPLARNSSEAERIIAATKSNGVKLMIGYPLPFSKPFVDLRHEMERGTFGDVQIAIANHISTGPFLGYITENGIPKPVPSWWFDKNLTGGGALIDLGCHMVNFLRLCFGEVKSVHSFLGYRFNMDFEDSATCVLRFQNGTIATLNVGWFSRYHKVQVELYGTTDSISVSSKSSRSWFNYLKGIFVANKSPTFFNEIKYFVDCLISDIQPVPSGEDGFEDIKIIEEAYRNTL